MALSSPALAAVAASPTWGLWARPADHPGKVALAIALLLGVVALVPRGPPWLAGTLDFSGVADLRRARRFLTIASFAAAFLSLAYIEFYLRGGPRAPEAAALWVQGRALSHGLFSWTAPDPTASFRATPLLFSLPDRLAGIAPPGYPMLLAPAFLVGAPMLVGPLLGAATVVATWQLAREIMLATPGRSPVEAEIAGRVAAGLSVVCVALRLETADLVPDGLVGLAMASALVASFRARREGRPRASFVPGLALGVVLATAPLSSLAVALVVTAVVASGGGTQRARTLAWIAAGAMPGLLFLTAANHAAIGRAFASPAVAYRAALAAHAAHAGAKAIALDVLRAARAHLADVANIEPLTLLVAIPLFGAARSRAARVAGVLIAVQAIADVAGAVRAGATPVDGSALGNLVPVEHALLGVGVVAVLPGRAVTAALLAMALSLGGFAVHTSHAHIARAAGDEGHPHYEPDVAREANVAHGLLFFDDDQGYELASDPAATASHGVEAARLRGDDHDRLLYDLLGHPPAHRYLSAATTASVTVWSPPNASSDAWRFEAEADWPPLHVTGGRADVVDGAGMCPPDAKALSLDPGTGPEATLAIELPAPRGSTPPTSARAWRVIPRVFLSGGKGEATMTLSEELGGPALARWMWKDATNGPGCIEIGEQTVTLGPQLRRTWLVLSARGGPVALDKTVLRAR
jgi:hypothetical protein